MQTTPLGGNFEHPNTDLGLGGNFDLPNTELGSLPDDFVSYGAGFQQSPQGEDLNPLQRLAMRHLNDPNRAVGKPQHLQSDQNLVVGSEGPTPQPFRPPNFITLQQQTQPNPIPITVDPFSYQPENTKIPYPQSAGSAGVISNLKAVSFDQSQTPLSNPQIISRSQPVFQPTQVETPKTNNIHQPDSTKKGIITEVPQNSIRNFHRANPADPKAVHDMQKYLEDKRKVRTKLS